MEEVVPLHFSVLIKIEIAEHKLHDDILMRHPMRSLINLLKLPILNLIQVEIPHPIRILKHTQYLLQLLRVLFVEDLAIFDHIDEEHLLRVILIVIVGDIVVIVVEMQLAELLLCALV